MTSALRVAVLAALLGCANARICCMAMPVCPAGFAPSDDACRAGESSTTCQTVSMCCTTLQCRPVAPVCTKYAEAQKCTERNHCYNVDECKCGRYPVPMCIGNPCDTAKCGTGYTCKPSYCAGCKYHCVRQEATPTPVVDTCTKYTEAQKCTEPNHCYNVDECKCGRYPVPRCIGNPCDTAKCGTGYTCKPSYCAGCKHHCVRAEPTPVPQVPAFCDQHGPTCSRSSHCKRSYKCVQDPTCSAGQCESCCCKVPQCKRGYFLRLRQDKCHRRALATRKCYEVSNNCGNFVCKRRF